MSWFTKLLSILHAHNKLFAILSTMAEHYSTIIEGTKKSGRHCCSQLCWQSTWKTFIQSWMMGNFTLCNRTSASISNIWTFCNGASVIEHSKSFKSFTSYKYQNILLASWVWQHFFPRNCPGFDTMTRIHAIRSPVCNFLCLVCVSCSNRVYLCVRKTSYITEHFVFPLSSFFILCSVGG